MVQVQTLLMNPFCHWYPVCVARGLWPLCPGADLDWCLKGKEKRLKKREVSA